MLINKQGDKTVSQSVFGFFLSYPHPAARPELYILCNEHWF